VRIGILGSGLMGGKLGTLFARAGHHVVFSYARSPRKLERLARAAGPARECGTVREATSASDVLLLAVHWSRMDDVLKQAGPLRGKVVVSCSLPMSADDGELAVAHTSSGAEVLAKRLRGAHFTAAFGTIPSEVLFDVFARRRRKPRPSMLLCGDDATARRTVTRLIRDLGFDPVDAGPLRSARFLEPFTLLIARLAYEGKRGPRLAYRFQWMERP
jgi:predicted dinucleotide-binding enzyme